MPVFEHSLVVRAPAERVFALSQDYGQRLRWDPFLREARLIGGASGAGPGVRAWCVSRCPPIGMETEYVSFERPEVVAVRMTRPVPLLRRFAGSWRFRALPGGETRVTFRYNFAARPAWLRQVLEPFLLAWFARENRLRLDGLRRYAERAVE